MLTIDELLAELREQFEDEDDFDLSLAGAWIRYSYGHAYTSALEEAEPDLQAAHKRERQAWAQLP